MILRAAALILLALLCANADARDPAQVRAFRKEHPCPATGKTSGACPGWVVDHRTPLCLQRYMFEQLDRPANMMWMTRADALVKDREERRVCAAMTLWHD